MADDAEELRTEVAEDESEGGPVKTFLEHLEDLRWVLIKSAAFLGIAVVACLLAGNVVVKVLTWPLERASPYSSVGAYVSDLWPVNRLSDSSLAQWPYTKWLFGKKSTLAVEEGQHISVYFLTNRLGALQLTKEEAPQSPFGSNSQVVLRIEPVPSGTNDGFWLLGVRADTNTALLPKENRLNIAIVNLSPAGGFIVAFNVAIYAGIVLSAPFILYFVAAFVFPALKMKERKYTYRGLFWGLGLFLTGISFCYFVLMPVALLASLQYTTWLGFSAPMWQAEQYIGFVSKFMLGMGVGFELPVVILVLAKLGIVNYAFLSKARRYVIVVNFTLGAILTTPEVITQILMALPLQLLYELTVWLVWWQERQEKKRKALEEEQGSQAQ